MEIVKLKDVAEIVSGSTPKTNKKEYWEGRIYWITPADLEKKSNGYIYSTSRKITDEGFESSNLKMLPVGTVLLTTRAPIGKVALAGVELCTNQGFKNIICNSAVLDSEYLYYYLASQYDQLNALGRGATFKEISKKIVEDIVIPLPPIKIQQKIVQVLDKAQSLIDKRKEQIELMDELIQSTFYEMFGDPAINKHSWTNSSIGESCYFVKDGPHKSLEYVESGIPFVSVKDIIKGKWDFSEVRYISNEVYEENKSRCKPDYGDILYTKGGTTGYAKLVDIDIKFLNWVHIAVLKFDKDKINGKYFEQMLNSKYCYEQAQKYTRGIANRDLVLSQMKRIRIVVPPLKLQNQFAEIVQKIEVQKQLMEQSLTEMENNYNSLMQRAFSGKSFN
ncbi:restriction endonuclease subunit S [Anoxynatronum sibiricum]|uniref:Restriction endonuclease subunit S n=1 Tax=Anoxynatronum sibiricum TaxID=210623 RepID=A0ABU9VTE2_9CLOT